MLAIALQMFLPHTSLVEIEYAKVMVEVMHCVKYFISYAYYSAFKASITS